MQKLGVDASGKLAAGAWSGLPDDATRGALQQGLLGILDVLACVAEECKDPKSIMSTACASNPWILVLTAVGIIGTLLDIGGIHRYWPLASGPTPSEQMVLRVIILMGALGGFLHWTACTRGEQLTHNKYQD